jgi:hypothetical protein
VERLTGAKMSRWLRLAMCVSRTANNLDDCKIGRERVVRDDVSNATRDQIKDTRGYVKSVDYILCVTGHHWRI